MTIKSYNTLGNMLDEYQRKCKAQVEAGKIVLGGFLSYREKDKGWNDSITIVDDDGMALCIDHVKAFDGKEVRITVELV